MTQLHNVLPPASEMAFIGDEPTWHEINVNEKNYTKEMMRGLNWHNYCASEKDYVKYMEQWIREYRSNTAKKDIALWRNCGDVRTTICVLARMQLQGFPLSAVDSQHIRNYVLEFTGMLETKKTATTSSSPSVNRLTIQDRIKAQVSTTLANLDGIIDDAFEGNVIEVEDLVGQLLSQGFKGPQLNLVYQYLDKNISEWNQAYNKEDEQLVEGYSYVNRKTFKKIIDTFNEAMSKISHEKTKVKATRIRKKKPTDKKKMASKLKFMPEFSDLKIKSLPAVDIIGANVIWVYDTKKRKLGYYEGEAKDSLFVRGTMIEGYKNTCVKTLRKPEEQIKQVMSLRKNQTQNWFETIKAKCGTLNGRTNSNLILLRID